MKANRKIDKKEVNANNKTMLAKMDASQKRWRPTEKT
jgi:hypothetical protein